MNRDAGARSEEEGNPVARTLLRVTYSRGIWEVTKDGHFFGHYHSRQPALHAAQAAAHAAAARGGYADISFGDDRPQGAFFAQTAASAALAR